MDRPKQEPERPSSNRYARALKILRRYYKILAEEAADDIVENDEDFVSDAFGKVDSLLERHSRRFDHLGNVFRHLSRFAPGRSKPEAKYPLQAGQFRCFGCGGLIRLQDEHCPKCGWTWNL